MTEPGKGEAIRKKLAQIAREKKIPYEKLATSFLLERMVFRLTLNQSICTNLVFKGGYVGLRVYHLPRFTVDLDAVLKGANLSDCKGEIINAAESNQNDGVWFRFESTATLVGQGDYSGSRFRFRGGIGIPLKDLSRAQIVELDIALGDAITPGPAHVVTESILGGESVSWQVYPIETIIAEKLHTLLTRGSENSRAKDVYDLHLFLPRCRRDLLEMALAATARARSEALPIDIAGALKAIDKGRLSKGWTSAVSGVPETPRFEDAFGIIVAFFEKSH